MGTRRELAAFPRERVKRLTVSHLVEVEGCVEYDESLLEERVMRGLAEELAAKLVEYKKVIISYRDLDGRPVCSADLYVVVPGGPPPLIISDPEGDPS